MIRFKRLLKSFKYAFKGLRRTFREEQNLRVQTIAGSLALFLGWLFQISRFDWIMLIFVVSLVILMELANSAVERVTDVLKPRISTYVKEIKDIMAAVVMLASLVSVIVGILIFWPYIIERFF